MPSGIYAILCRGNSKIYIGQASQLTKRMQQHQCDLKGNRHINSYMQNSWNKYGSELFSFEVLEYCPIEELNSREAFWIDLLNTICPNGFNYKTGGEAGVSISEEARQNMREAALRLWSDPDHREKMSDAKKGITFSEEARKSRSKFQRRKWSDPDYRKKQSEAMKLGWSDPNAREKMREANLGKTHAEETRKKMSENTKKLWADPNFREKMKKARENRRSIDRGEIE